MDERCVFCKKEATKLCDFPMGYLNFVGHTPKILCVYDSKGNEISSDILNRCSRPICDDCSTEWNGMDFCPHCVDEMKNIIIRRQNKKLEKKHEHRNWKKRKRSELNWIR